MVTELLSPVFVLVVGYLIKLASVKLKIELEEKVFNTIVAGIVTFLLAQLGLTGATTALGYFGLR